MNFRNMSEDKFYEFCKSRLLDDEEILLAKSVLQEGVKGQELYDLFECRWSPNTIKTKRSIIFAKLGIIKY